MNQEFTTQEFRNTYSRLYSDFHVVLTKTKNEGLYHIEDTVAKTKFSANKQEVLEYLAELQAVRYMEK